MAKIRPVYFVRLDIQRLGIEIGDRKRDSDLAKWLRNFHRALALGRPDMNEYAAELLSEADDFRTTDRKRKTKVPTESNGIHGNPMESNGRVVVSKETPLHTSIHTSIHTDIQEGEEDAHAHVDSDGPDQEALNRALKVMDAYPDKSTKDGRPVKKDTAAQSVLAARISKSPDYPFEEHARLERLNPYPMDAWRWAQTVPDEIALAALRKVAGGRGSAAAPLSPAEWKGVEDGIRALARRKL